MTSLFDLPPQAPTRLAAARLRNAKANQAFEDAQDVTPDQRKALGRELADSAWELKAAEIEELQRLK